METKKKTKKEAVKKENILEANKKNIEIDLFNQEGKTVGKMSLPEKVFGLAANPKLIAQAVRVYLANQRRGTASTKTRGQVEGSTRKIYKQKGTGRARHGDIKAPIFVGGGIVHGPKPRDFSLKMSKKMRRSALFQALSLKLKETNLKVVDSLDSLPGKTKEMLKVFNNLKVISPKKRDNDLLLVLAKPQENVIKSARNIKGVTVASVNSLNTYTIMENKKIVFLKDSITELVKIFKI